MLRIKVPDGHDAWRMADANSILNHLRTVDAERERRDASPGLAARVQALKRYQQRRFAHTYDDLLKTSRYGPAARFFLDELYGPRDYSERDAQFARVVPALARLSPFLVATAEAAPLAFATLVLWVAG